MTIRAEIQNTSVMQIIEPQSRLPVVGQEVMGIRSELVVLDPNSIRIEHFKPEGDSYILCGKSPVFHRDEISEAGVEVILATGSSGDVTGKIEWKKDGAIDAVKSRLSQIRRELRLISQD